MSLKKKTKQKKTKDDLKETILSTESYGFQKKREYLLFLNPQQLHNNQIMDFKIKMECFIYKSIY